MKSILISGIQPTGALHLGNYLGALKNFVDLQNTGRYDCFFMIADYHSLTESFDPKQKPKQVMDLALDFLAAGIDPKRSTVFIQSSVPAHAELTWIFNTLTPFGELRRMTQFKDKSEHDPKNINVGLFDYPVLMAVDILLYSPKFVPVGEDQLQHIEFTRMLAKRFNSKFGKTFIEPQELLTEVPRLMSLDNPTKKMSKSRPAGCIFVDDSPEKIKIKITRAVTDSGKEIRYDSENKPAISNLLLMYSALSEKSVKSVEKSFEGATYSQFKNDLSEIVINALKPFQKRKRELKRKSAYMRQILKEGSASANYTTSKKMREVRKRIGLTV